MHLVPSTLPALRKNLANLMTFILQPHCLMCQHDIYLSSTLFNVPPWHSLTFYAFVSIVVMFLFCRHHAARICVFFDIRIKREWFISGRCVNLIGIHHLNILTMNWQRVLDISQGFFSAYISELLQHYIIWSSTVATQAVSRTDNRTTNNQCLATPRQL